MQTQSGRLPDFFIVGAAKSATTSLYAYACDHPDIFMPMWKEPHFFSYAEHAPYRFVPAANLFQYANLFAPARPDQVIGEASTSYLYEYEKTIARMRQAYGPDFRNIKIIISLRDPAHRAFSHYSMYSLYGLETLPFSGAMRTETVERLESGIDVDRFGIVMDYIRAGMYYEPVKAYMEAFPNVHVVLYDDIRRDASGVMRGIFRFLGVFEDFPVSCATEYNATGAPRFKVVGAALNAAHAMVMTKRSRAKNFLIWLISRCIDWGRVRIPILFMMNKMGRKLFIMNTRKVSIPQEECKRLTGIYRQDILRLQGLIRRDLSAWL